jgi:glycosyltransferase involved in cell wall biosynthesis
VFFYIDLAPVNRRKIWDHVWYCLHFSYGFGFENLQLEPGMSYDPSVTVVIPACNAERTIGETISSVLAQTFTRFELLIINDGSVDETAMIVELSFLSDPRVCLINQQNGGVAAARNRGISTARSELIAPLDADDLWHPTYLEKQINTLSQQDTAGFVYAWSRYIDAESNIIRSAHYPVVAGRVLGQLLYWNFVGNGSAMIFRKSAALEFGGYDDRLISTQDLMLQIKLASRHECAVTSEYLVGYRQHLGQKSRNPQLIYHSWLRILDLVQNECEGVPEKVINWKMGELHFISAVRAYFEGRLGDAVQLLKLAYQSDPLGTIYRIGSLIYQRGSNLIGRARRGLYSTPSKTVKTPFFEARTDEIVRPQRSVLWDHRLKYLRQLDDDRSM